MSSKVVLRPEKRSQNCIKNSLYICAKMCLLSGDTDIRMKLYRIEKAYEISRRGAGAVERGGLENR